jgi:hypothetical protein
MRTSSIYTDSSWEFVESSDGEVWNIGNGRNNGYPYLAWQYPDDPADSPPILSTVNFLPISNAEISITGSIEYLGNPLATQHGFCWNTSGSPTLEDSYNQLGSPSQMGEYSTTITSLTPGVMYYFRAYATSANGTSYGKQIRVVPHGTPQGSGTSLDPYLMSSLGDLYWLANSPEHWDKHYRQVADIDASNTQYWYDGQGWMPIGKMLGTFGWSSEYFSGHFDGDGFPINGLYINRPELNGVGLFGAVSGKISRVYLQGIDFTGNDCVGGLIGFANGAEIFGCFIEGIIQGNSEIGGVIGQNQRSNISNSTVQVSISGTSSIGGLIGASWYEQVIRNSFSSVTINGNSKLGGITGSAIMGE